MKNYKYENVPCPHCRTIHQIKKNDRNIIINCLCGKKLMVVAVEGKYEFMEVQG